MPIRLREPALRLIAILAAALGGCQTAGTGPDTSNLRAGLSLSAAPKPVAAKSATDSTTAQASASASDTAAPHIQLALDAGDRPTAPSPSGDDPEFKHLAADFTVATTVPALPSSSTAKPSLPETHNGAGTDTQRPLVADLPPEPGGLGTSTNPSTVPLTLDAAIAVSLDRNPTLVSQRAGEPVAQAALDVAKHYPFNPYVQVEATPIVKDLDGGNGAVLHYVLLMQTLEFAHQQRFREESAAAALNQVRWNIVNAELTNVALTERLYFTALYQKGLRDLAARTAALNEDVAGDVERRFKAGLSKPGEDITARVSLRQSRKQAALAEQNYKVALLALVRQLNIEREQNYELIGRLDEFEWHPISGDGAAVTADAGPVPDPHVPPELAENFANERPDVRAAQAGANVAESNACLARANIIQNIQAGPYYERDDFGTLFFGFRAQMNVPIWDSGRPLAHQREAEYAQQAITFNELKSRARVEVQTALDRYERARLLAQKERPNLAKSLADDLGRVKRQYEAGQADVLNVFATQTALLQEQRAYLDLLNELALAASDVTLSAGLPPARIVTAARIEAPAAPPAAPAP